MSLIRCLYLVCWRNRLLIPLIITCASFAMLITLFYHRTFVDLMEHNDEYLPHKHNSLVDMFGAIGKKEKRELHHLNEDWPNMQQRILHENDDSHQDLHGLPGIHDPGGLMVEHAKRHAHDNDNVEHKEKIDPNAKDEEARKKLERRKIDKYVQRKREWEGVAIVREPSLQSISESHIDQEGLAYNSKEKDTKIILNKDNLNKNLGLLNSVKDPKEETKRSRTRVFPDESSYRSNDKQNERIKESKKKSDFVPLNENKRKSYSRKKIMDNSDHYDIAKPVNTFDAKKDDFLQKDEKQNHNTNKVNTKFKGAKDYLRPNFAAEKTSVNHNIPKKVNTGNRYDDGSKLDYREGHHEGRDGAEARSPVRQQYMESEKQHKLPQNVDNHRVFMPSTKEKSFGPKYEANEAKYEANYSSQHANRTKLPYKVVNTKHSRGKNKPLIYKESKSKKYQKNFEEINQQGDQQNLVFKESLERHEEVVKDSFFRPKYAEALKHAAHNDQIPQNQDKTYRIVEKYLNSKKNYKNVEANQKQLKFVPNQNTNLNLVRDINDKLDSYRSKPKKYLKEDQRQNLALRDDVPEVNLEKRFDQKIGNKYREDKQEYGGGKREFKLGPISPPPATAPTHDLHGHLNTGNLWDKIKHNRSFAYDVRPDHQEDDKWIPNHSKKLFRHRLDKPEVFIQWDDDSDVYCDGNFKGYHNEFAMIRNVVLDKSLVTGREGGEEIKNVINQPEEDEYYQFQFGFLQLPCEMKPDYFFNNNNHNNQWLASMRTVMRQNAKPVDDERDQFTIAITRYEYANIYHTMTDFYNAFLLMEYFDKTQSQTNILIVDGHPRGALDPVWSVLFNSSQRISKLKKRTHFKNLVWGILGYDSMIMDHYSPNLPLVSEFRNFFLSSYKISDNHKLNCDNINIMFIWRRDYLAHPRNPSGSISRKIQNEQELVDTLRKQFPNFSVKGIQIDLFDMRQQLKFVSKTDIMIGMHGAGLTHAMFLPAHAGVIELLPVYWAAANEHFEAISRWRDLLYLRWVNTDPSNEAPNYHTIVPPDVLNTMVTSTVEHMCQTEHREGKSENNRHHQFGR